MAMVVKNNMSAVSTLNTLNKNSSALQKSLAKVSSGMKINSAQDDASGYAISEKMRVQIRSLDQANQNTQNASSLMKTAEGAVSSTVEILKSLKEKAINAATDTNKDSDRATIQKEIDQFIDQIDDNALTTFNGKYLVDGSKSQYGQATYTALTNQSLATDTNASSKLTDLANRNNESLEIASTDFVTASYVQNGKTYTTKFQVGDATTLENVFEKLNSTGGSGFTNAANITPSTTSTTPGNTGTAYDGTTINASNSATYIAAAQTVDNSVSDATTASAALSTLVGTFTAGDTTAATTTLNGAISSLTAAAAAAAYGMTYNGATFSATDLSTAATEIGDSNNWVAGANNASGLTPATAAASATSLVGSATDTTTLLGKAVALYNAVQAYGVTSDTTTTTAGNQASSIVVDSSDVGISSANNVVHTTDSEVGLTVTSAKEGIEGQISGVTLSITDSEGNVKKSANAALDDFKTTIYAKNPSTNNEMTFQVGANANQSITVGLDDMRAEALGLKSSDGQKVSVTTQDNANAAVAVFDNAIQKALDQQTTIGAIEARLDYTSQNLTTSSENTQAAESTIRDADMAKEMTNYTKNNVLLQAAQSMLAQANQSSSQVLSLLQ